MIDEAPGPGRTCTNPAPQTMIGHGHGEAFSRFRGKRRLAGFECAELQSLNGCLMPASTSDLNSKTSSRTPSSLVRPGTPIAITSSPLYRSCNCYRVADPLVAHCKYHDRPAEKMADPASVAGTAVGVLSLGIQVCQGLYDLISTIRGRNKELDSAAAQLQCLVSSFQDLSTILPRISSLPPHHTTAVDTLRSCIAESEIKINQLQLLLSSLKNTASGTNDLKGKLRDTTRILTFPLQRKELQSMQQELASLVTTVQLAIDTISV